MKYDDSFLKANPLLNLPFELLEDQEKDDIITHAARLFDEGIKAFRARDVADARMGYESAEMRQRTETAIRADAWDRAMKFGLEAARFRRNYDPVPRRPYREPGESLGHQVSAADAENS